MSKRKKLFEMIELVTKLVRFFHNCSFETTVKLEILHWRISCVTYLCKHKVSERALLV